MLQTGDGRDRAEALHGSFALSIYPTPSSAKPAREQDLSHPRQHSARDGTLTSAWSLINTPMANLHGNPILEARPPVTDSFTYLTLLEYNLNEHNVHQLNAVLREDHSLAATIGWDLVQILLPFTPASNDCLSTVARLGNPREVILKVTEALLKLQPNGHASDLDEADAEARASTPDADLSSSVQRYTILLDMLPTLHSRIRARRPSRFLATSLRAVSVAYESLMADASDIYAFTEHTVRFLAELAASVRPRLPPRSNDSNIIPAHEEMRASDPEALESTSLAPTDSRVSSALCASFLIRLCDTWAASLNSEDDIPGLGIADRVREVLSLDRKIPGRPTFGDLFADRVDLRAIDDLMHVIYQAGTSLSINAELLHRSICASDYTGDWLSDEDVPERAEDVCVSSHGALILSAWLELQALRTDAAQARNPYQDFSSYHAVVMAVANPQLSLLDQCSTATLDAMIGIGLRCIQERASTCLPQDEAFFRHLQALTSISASSQSPRLRYNAHLLATKTLQQHPVEQTRLTFISDTLEHCPYDNLKVSALGWLKEEILRAFGDSKETSALFKSPATMDKLSTLIFPDLTQEMTFQDVAQDWLHIRSNMSAYMSTLNFYYLLVSRADMATALGLRSFHTNNDIAGSYLGPLRQACTLFSKKLHDGQFQEMKEDEANSTTNLMDLMLLDRCLDKVEQGIIALNRV